MERSIPENIVDYLGGDLSNCRRFSYVVEPGQDIGDLMGTTSELLNEKIRPHYDNMGIDVKNKVGEVLLESLKTAIFYGDNRPVEFDTILNHRALVSRCFGGGEYFKDSLARDIWQDRIPISKADVQRERSVGFSLDDDLIRHEAGLIHVDTQDGVLYVGLPVGPRCAD